jgi:glycosyltransferase involved in cell wall biosynthesis
VQVEAMICGTPTVASDMPGMRQPVLMTGMGRLFPPRNETGLAEAILEILDHPQDYQGDQPAITRRFSPDTIAAGYEELFQTIVRRPK